MPKAVINKDGVNKNDTKNKNKNIIKEEVKIVSNDNENDNENEEGYENPFKRDETKWKYSKAELLERKKKLLKDKSKLKPTKK